MCFFYHTTDISWILTTTFPRPSIDPGVYMRVTSLASIWNMELADECLKAFEAAGLRMHNLVRQVTSVCCVPHASFMKYPVETCHGELFKYGGNNKSKSHILMQKIRNQLHSHLLQRPSFEHYYCSRKKHKPVEVSVLLYSDISSCAHCIFVSLVLYM